ncbi:response regulator [Novosphingobium sp. SG720]|uniref:response regulator n=1 Tax=Novosphingobium TaxID=165696 RepID=UPI0014459256|nr:response regulator [Novosphingobium sp. SG720]NKJ42856.1 DNA-binding response OmpR family regulator [Novosphingobium sp. SG720]
MTADYVLVLEDNVLVAMEIEDELAARGHSVASAVDLAEAEALVAQGLPRIALLDLRLPDGDSTTLALRLAEQGCAVALISGADSGIIPASLAKMPRFPKPTGVWQLADWADGIAAAG